MKKLSAVIKGELKRYFASPVAVVYLIAFLLLNSSFALYFGGIFTKGNATLRPMFDFIPWIYLLFVSGIAMRLWAEEFKSKTILQIMTMPMKLETYVWGKFLAAWLFCIIGLLLTFPFVITINVLGNPDNGIIFSSYTGAIVLSGAMLAIAQFASAMTRNQVIALVIAVVLNLLFFLCGLEYVLGLLRNIASDYFVETIASFSFLIHVDNFNSGLFRLSDVIFFVSLIILFNELTILILANKTWGKFAKLKINNAWEMMLAGILMSVLFVGINLLGNVELSNKQIDLTAEKLYTPSDATKNILRNLSSPVVAKVYYSKILGERNEEIRLQMENLQRLLRQYKKLSKGKFDYYIYNTEPLSEEEDYAINAGLQGLPIVDLNAAAYFGMQLSNENGNNRTIPLFTVLRQNLMEQDIIENVYLLEHKPLRLGILTSLPMMGESVGQGVISAKWQIIDELKKYYELVEINNPEDLNNIDLLMMAHPQITDKNMENAIYDFSIKGGKILAFFDIMPEVLGNINTRKVFFGASDYGDLPKKWGFHFYDDIVLADLKNSTHVTVDAVDYSGTVQDLIQFYVTNENMFADLPEVAKLNRILMTSASIFMPLKDALIYFVPLMQSSSKATMMNADVVRQRMHPSEILRRFKEDEQPKFLAAHILSQSKDKPFELIVVGDSDMLYDSFWAKNLQMGKYYYSVPLLDNLNFVLNALDVLRGNDIMLSLRGKSAKPRPFEDLELKQKQILRDYKLKEKDVFDQIEFIKKELSNLISKKSFELRDNFSFEELKDLSILRQELNRKKQELYKIRLESNQYMESVELKVKLFNIYMVPLLIVVGLLIVNRKKIAFIKPEKIYFNKKLLFLAAIALLFFACGVADYYFNKQSERNDISGKVLFDNLEEQINNVVKLRIKNNSGDIVLIKKDGKWQVEGKEGYVFNHKRLRFLLDALLEARIVEKKSDKIENLKRFGLHEGEDSRATKVELKDADDKNIIAFSVGDYNVNLSRGAVGAYIKTDNQFQVWLSKVDLVDLSTDYHDWVLANLWDLQLGRLVKFEEINNQKNLAEMVAIMINTKLGEKKDFVSEADLYQTYNIKGEYFDNLQLSIFQDNENYYISYNFSGIKKYALLEQFAKYMNKFYKIEKADIERINNVIAKE